MKKRTKLRLGIGALVLGLLGVCSSVRASNVEITQYRPDSNNAYIEDDEGYGDLSIKDDLQYLGINMFDLPFIYTDYHGTSDFHANYDDYTAVFLGAIPSDMGGMMLYFWDNHNLTSYQHFNDVEISYTINDVDYVVPIQTFDWRLPRNKHPFNEYNGKDISSEWNPSNLWTDVEGWPLISNVDYDNNDFGNVQNAHPVTSDLKYHNYGVKCLKLYDSDLEERGSTRAGIVGTRGEYQFRFNSISYKFDDTAKLYLYNSADKYKYTMCSRVTEYYNYEVTWKDSKLTSGGEVSYAGFSDISLHDYKEITYTTINQTYTWHQTKIYCEKIGTKGYMGTMLSLQDGAIYYALMLNDLTTGERISNVESIQFTSDNKKHVWSKYKSQTTVVDFTEEGNVLDWKYFEITRIKVENGFYLQNAEKWLKKRCSFNPDFELAYTGYKCKNLNFVYCTYKTVGEEVVHGSFYEEGLHPEYDDEGKIIGIFDMNGNLTEYLYDKFGTPINPETGKYVIAENQVYTEAKRGAYSFFNIFKKIKGLGLSFTTKMAALLSILKISAAIFVIVIFVLLFIKIFRFLKIKKN